MCRHCGIRKINRPKGLCWKDYYTPGITRKYKSTSKYATRGHGNGNFHAPLPPHATPHPPDTAEKVAEFEKRAKAGVQLFHPLDARYAGDKRWRATYEGDSWQVVGDPYPELEPAEPQSVTQSTLVTRGEGESGNRGDDD